MAAPGRVAALFDVDKTILARNSGRLFLQELYERGEVDIWTVLRNLAAYLNYKLNRLDVDRWAERALRQMTGHSEQELMERSETFFEERVRPLIYPEAEARVRWHLDQGHLVALVTGSTRFVVEPLLAHLGVKHAVCTELEVKDGRLTGRVAPPICFGRGKVSRLRRLIDSERIDLVRSWFYTDSLSDLPLLELVGYPMAVNPDPGLYREARRRRWPISFYAEPG
jgi:HAD superfamily hydrolase (TIGR01490 family)